MHNTCYHYIFAFGLLVGFLAECRPVMAGNTYASSFHRSTQTTTAQYPVYHPVPHAPVVRTSIATPAVAVTPYTVHANFSGSSRLLTSTAAPATLASGPRRLKDNGNGSYDGSFPGEIYEGNYWDEKNEEWAELAVGVTIQNKGVTFTWNGTAWEITGGQIPDMDLTPIGSTPYLLFFLLLLAYATYHHRKKRFSFQKNAFFVSATAAYSARFLPL